MEKGEIFDEMNMICKKLKLSSQRNFLFEPEFNISLKINNEIKKLEKVTQSNAIKLIDLFNEINNIEHYDGSAWLDYKIHLASFLSINGHKVKSRDKFIELDI